MGDFFYWMGVIFSGIFLLIGLFVFVGIVVDYLWGKMRNTYNLADIIMTYNAHKKDKP